MTDTQSTDEEFASRLHALLTHAVSSLDPQDREERIKWCVENNVHGVRMHLTEGDDLLEFRWGGRKLAMFRSEVLLNNRPIHTEFVADGGSALDIVPAEWTEQ